MRTTSAYGFLYSDLCSRVGHKRYRNIFEDLDSNKDYVYETDSPSFMDGIRDIEDDSNYNSFIDESVELVFAGDEPTNAELDDFCTRKAAMHKIAEEKMIEYIKTHGEQL